MPSQETTSDRGLERVEQEDGGVVWTTDNQCHDNVQAGQRQADSWPCAFRPPTVLVTELDNGVLVIQGRPHGPRARLSSADAEPLKRELTAAFERAEVGPRDNPDDSW